ncbi:MAG: S53 family peptidase [Thermoplasmata archaeon]
MRQLLSRVNAHPRWTSAGWLAVALALLMLLPSASVFASAPGPQSVTRGLPNETALVTGPRIPVPILAAGPLPASGGTPFQGNVSVFVTLRLQNQSALDRLLSALSDPHSSGYRHYLTAGEFARGFSPSTTTYEEAVRYFSGIPGLSLSTYRDRVGLLIHGPAASVGRAFGVHLDRYASRGPAPFEAPVGTATLPEPFGLQVLQVAGLDSRPMARSDLRIGEHASVSGTAVGVHAAAYPAPSTCYSGGQCLWGSDLQVAYDEPALFNMTFPTHEVVATILWSGTNSSGQSVGPFVPSDISTYFNQTLPAGQPHPHIYGVPVNGAPKPGISASYDQSGANIENTLDLEMVGSSAPGSSIYNVYGPSATYANLNDALAYILNPNSSTPGLKNVSVITNSWGGSDQNDSSWYQYLEEAQARGITVLASSGDSGDNPNSSKWSGTGPEFPSTMAYNDFGVTAVGGTTLTVNDHPISDPAQYLHIQSQIAWNVSANDTSDGGPLGSSGGISSVFAEPSWQKSTEANAVIQGRGRGVPDIAAIANNTWMYASSSGSLLQYEVAGTSIASPLVAGLVAEINSVLAHEGAGSLGFANPSIYEWANQMVAPMNTTLTTGFLPTGSYNSTLPTLPFYDVTQGQNFVDRARYGYDLVTGWGSLDAYNFTMYVLDQNYSGSAFSLQGIRDQLHLAGLNVTSYFSGGRVNTDYNASIQQNFFLGNSLGAPVYWVQNVIYINGSQSVGWALNYTGWVIFPFYGLYPAQSVYEYNFPVGTVLKLPQTFTITSWLSDNATGATTMNFGVNGQHLTLPVPGAEYIIGGLNNSYYWQGTQYTNGPYPPGHPGGLSPQFGLVGGPSGGQGQFEAPTHGSLNISVEPTGGSAYVAPLGAETMGAGTSQTGESARNLAWQGAVANWTLGIQSGSAEQGVLAFAVFQGGNPAAGPSFPVNFEETGLPGGQSWSVRLAGADGTSNGSTIQFLEGNGNYSFAVRPLAGFRASPDRGIVTVNGSSITVPIVWTPVTYPVTFQETGLPPGAGWNVSLAGGGSVEGTGATLTIAAPNGTFDFTYTPLQRGYAGGHGVLTVNGTGVNRTVAFVQLQYAITFRALNLTLGIEWSVTLAGDLRSTTQGSLTFSRPNGTYAYTIGGVPGWTTSGYSGQVQLLGSPVVVPRTWSRFVYEAAFTETGLPAGAAWWVAVDGVRSNATGDQAVVALANGTYRYSIGTRDSRYAAAGGLIPVQGSAPVVAVPFMRVTYLVTIVTAGGPTGAAWSVTINGTTQPSTGTTVVLPEANGSYPYRITPPSGYRAQPPAGTLTVNGTATDLPVEFVRASSAGGLFAGTSGEILIGGIVAAAAILVAVGVSFGLRRRSSRNR